jgi:hypothetical protein
MIKILIALGVLHASLLWANSTANPVVDRLDHSLMTDYLDYAQAVLGDCGEDTCLVDGRLQTADTEVCFPATSCGYYLCMEEKRPCKSVGVPYFTELAAPTCASYVSNMNSEKFSAQGIEWIYEVMVCLQKGLFDECEIQGACDRATLRESCDYIEDFTLKFHPGCYLESGVGVCSLSLKDQHMIWKTVGPFLTGREWIEAFKVVLSCMR